MGASVSLTADGAGFGGGQAASFAGTIDATNAIVLPIDINASAIGDMTMGAWVYSTGTVAGNGKLLSHDNGGFDRTLGSDSRGATSGFDWAAFTGSGVVDIDVPQVTLEWIFLAVRYDGTNTKLTVNGTTVTGPDTTDNGSGLTTLTVGNNPSFLTEAFIGLVDNVFVFDEALSDADLETFRLNGGLLPAVPLPASAALLLAGLGAMGLAGRRRA